MRFVRGGVAAFSMVLVATAASSVGPAQASRPTKAGCVVSAAIAGKPDVGMVCAAIIDNPKATRAARANALVVRGVWHEIGKRVEDAKRDYDEGLRLAPEHATLLRLRAGLHYVEGEVDKAKELARRSAEIDPNEADTFNLLGRIARASGDLKSALAYYNRVIELRPGDAVSRFSRATLLVSMGRPLESLADTQRLLAQPPAILDKTGTGWVDDRYVPLHLASLIVHANTLRALDRYEDAEKAYNTVIGQYRNGFTLTQRSKFLHGLPIGAGMLSRLQEAMKDAEEAVHRDPNNAKAWRQLASTLEYSKRPAEALEALDIALHLEGDKSVRPVLIWTRARLLRTLGNLHEAVETGRESLRLAQEQNQIFLQDRVSRFQRMGYWLTPKSDEQTAAALADAVKACMADEKCW